MRKSLFILLLILALFSTDVLLAQGGGPPGNSSPPSPPNGGSGPGNANDVSITTFLWILGLAGAYLGIKKVN